MPYVNIKITREGAEPGQTRATPAQKAALIKGVSELLLKVLNKPLAATFVVIDEVELEDWGVGGLPVDEYRRAAGETVAKTSGSKAGGSKKKKKKKA